MDTNQKLTIFQLILTSLSMGLILWQQKMFTKNLTVPMPSNLKNNKDPYWNLHFTVKNAYQNINEAIKMGQTRLRINVSEMPCKPDFMDFYKSLTYGHKIKHTYEHDRRTDREYMIFHLDTYLGPKNKPLEHIIIPETAADREFNNSYSYPPPIPVKKTAGDYEFLPSKNKSPAINSGKVIAVDFKSKKIIN